MNKGKTNHWNNALSLWFIENKQTMLIKNLEMQSQLNSETPQLGANSQQEDPI